MTTLMVTKLLPHPTPEAALVQLHGLTAADLIAIIKHAVNYGLQTAPVRGIERYYLADLFGFQYNFHYYITVAGSSYRLRNDEATWAIEFMSSARYPAGPRINTPYVLMPLITSTRRACFDFHLDGDKEQFRHDITKLKMFL